MAKKEPKEPEVPIETESIALPLLNSHVTVFSHYEPCHVCGHENMKCGFDPDRLAFVKHEKTFYECDSCGSLCALTKPGHDPDYEIKDNTAILFGLHTCTAFKPLLQAIYDKLEPGGRVLIYGPFRANRTVAVIEAQSDIHADHVTVPDVAGIGIAGREIGFSYEYDRVVALTKL